MEYDMSGARRFEFEGEKPKDKTKSGKDKKTSFKFWVGKRLGNLVVVLFGRVGTDGQFRVKEFDNEELAEKHLKSQTQQKVKKGYKRVS